MESAVICYSFREILKVMDHITHVPTPIFQQQECRVLLIGFACGHCGLALRRSGDLLASRSAPAPYLNKSHSIRENVGNNVRRAMR